MYTSIIATFALAASVLAAPAPVEKRQGAVTCGSTVRPLQTPFHQSVQRRKLTFIPTRQYYSSSQVAQAVNQGCDYYQSGQQVGSNDYPHRYNNYEGFDFRASGPWQEFPLLRSGPYTGGES